MPRTRIKTSGFSLLEVVIAVGIFAVAVSALLGLLPALTRQSAVSNDLLTALRLPDALRAELRRMATTGGFDALAGQVAPLAMPLPDTCVLVATRDGARLHALSYLAPIEAEAIGVDQQFYQIETWRFPDPPLSFDASAAVLALHVRVSWPYRIPGSLAVTPLAEREQITFNLALNR